MQAWCASVIWWRLPIQEAERAVDLIELMERYRHPNFSDENELLLALARIGLIKARAPKRYGFSERRRAHHIKEGLLSEGYRRT